MARKYFIILAVIFVNDLTKFMEKIASNLFGVNFFKKRLKNLNRSARQ
jgi:hypothetical protein